MLPQLLRAAAAVVRRMILWSFSRWLPPNLPWPSLSSTRQRLHKIPVIGRWFTTTTVPQPDTTTFSSTSANAGVAGSSDVLVPQVPNTDYRTQLPSGLQQESLPRHVAVIMDGNSRWANARGLLASVGHEEGIKPLMNMIKLSVDWGISVLTVFAFSYENWQRPKAEVELLMCLMESWFHDHMEELQRLRWP